MKRNRKYLVTFFAKDGMGTMYMMADQRPSQELIMKAEEQVHEMNNVDEVAIFNIIEVDMDEDEKKEFKKALWISIGWLLLFGVFLVALFLFLMAVIQGMATPKII
jgi:hypothetical protein